MSSVMRAFIVLALFASLSFTSGFCDDTVPGSWRKADLEQVVKKPALYLYPESKTTVEVRLGPKGRITKTIPEYKDKWKVTVDSKGRIDRKYRYLFYEAQLDTPIAQPQEGWCVRSGELGTWMRSHLPLFGLNSREAKDFRAYWLKNLPKSTCWIIRMIQPEVVDDQLGLIIRPEPKSLLRVLLHFTPSKEMVKLREPEIRRFEREGFVAVEWGGIIGSTDRKEMVK
ncbi:MAG: hypothetical protein FDX30_08795 [Chlorobium sp.]|nr:MAG: hypothetical protein FDX30_08795 [Chlorobium sp.]